MLDILVELEQNAGNFMNMQLENLYRRFGPAIYSKCRRMLQDRHAAEDATQEVFLKSYLQLEKLPSELDALRFLYRVATNTCLNMIRNQKNRSDSLQKNTSFFNTDETNNPERQSMDREMLHRLLACMPEKLVAPAVLFYVDGMEQKTIAKTLGVTRRTIINRLNDFQKRVQKVAHRQGAST